MNIFVIFIFFAFEQFQLASLQVNIINAYFYNNPQVSKA